MEKLLTNYQQDQFATEDQQILVFDPVLHTAIDPEDEDDNGDPVNDENYGGKDLDEQFPTEDDLKEDHFEMDQDIFINEEDDDDDY